MMKKCDENIRRTLDLVDRMAEIANEGDMDREDSGCGVLYGVLRDSAYKIRKLAEEEREAHVRKGWWLEERKKAAPPGDTGECVDGPKAEGSDGRR
jgi:hypothetical protein